MKDPKDPKTVLGLPTDFSKPTVARIKSRMWNAQDGRFFTPKSFGAGWDFNFYWVFHPRGYIRRRSK
jgi:hypothetical protein